MVQDADAPPSPADEQMDTTEEAEKPEMEAMGETGTNEETATGKPSARGGRGRRRGRGRGRAPGSGRKAAVPGASVETGAATEVTKFFMVNPWYREARRRRRRRLPADDRADRRRRKSITLIQTLRLWSQKLMMRKPGLLSADAVRVALHRRRAATTKGPMAADQTMRPVRARSELLALLQALPAVVVAVPRDGVVDEAGAKAVVVAVHPLLVLRRVKKMIIISHVYLHMIAGKQSKRGKKPGKKDESDEEEEEELELDDNEEEEDEAPADEEEEEHPEPITPSVAKGSKRRGGKYLVVTPPPNLYL